MEDELAIRREQAHVNLVVNAIKSTLDPELQGYGGSLKVYPSNLDLPDDKQGLRETRRIAQKAGEKLGWSVKLYQHEGGIFVSDTRGLPDSVKQVLMQRVDEAYKRERAQSSQI